MNPRIVNKAILIDHAVAHATTLDKECAGGEIQPIANLPDDPPQIHLIVIRGEARNLSWHPAYKWHGGQVYIPSGGIDLILVAAGPEGTMHAQVGGLNFS